MGFTLDNTYCHKKSSDLTLKSFKSNYEIGPVLTDDDYKTTEYIIFTQFQNIKLFYFIEENCFYKIEQKYFELSKTSRMLFVRNKNNLPSTS